MAVKMQGKDGQIEFLDRYPVLRGHAKLYRAIAGFIKVGGFAVAAMVLIAGLTSLQNSSTDNGVGILAVMAGASGIAGSAYLASVFWSMQAEMILVALDVEENTRVVASQVIPSLLNRRSLGTFRYEKYYGDHGLVMVCPECGDEYLPDVRHCTKCDVELVEGSID